jgi:hypothetical protein
MSNVHVALVHPSQVDLPFPDDPVAVVKLELREGGIRIEANLM